MKLTVIVSVVVLSAAASAAVAQSRAGAVNLTLTPARVHRGSSVAIRGHAGDCPVGDSVTVISHAFTATHTFAGVPAVFARVRSGGVFHTTTTIPRTKHVGRYVVTARCGGGNLGVAPKLTVLR
jgi:hypothetical protein